MENLATSQMIKWRIGYAADPAIEMLLPKDKIAQLKIHEIDMRIRELESLMDSLRMTQKVLKEQYKV